MIERIAYAEHPLSQQEKKEIQDQGYPVIIDLKFRPAVLSENEKIFTKSKKRKPLVDD